MIIASSLLLLFEDSDDTIIMYKIEGVLPPSKKRTFKRPGTKPNQVLFKIQFFLQKQKALECKIGSAAGFTWLLSHTEVVPTMQQSQNSKFQKRIKITM